MSHQNRLDNDGLRFGKKGIIDILINLSDIEFSVAWIRFVYIYFAGKIVNSLAIFSHAYLLTYIDKPAIVGILQSKYIYCIEK